MPETRLYANGYTEVASALKPFSDVGRKLWRPFTPDTQLFPNTHAEFEGNLKPLTDLECTGESPLCTDLLIDPVGVLSDRTRWPSHFCRDFLHESRKRWIHSVVPPEVADIFPYRLVSENPLNLGRQFWANCRHINLPRFRISDREYIAMLSVLPFEGDDFTIWALRVDRGSSVLDLFGLIDVRHEEGTYHMGALSYVLRGRDRSLVDVIAQADRWWAQFRGETFDGRPLGTGTWGSAADFEEALRAVARRLKAEGRNVTQENVAAILHCSARSINRWLKRYDIKWNDIRKAP